MANLSRPGPRVDGGRNALAGFLFQLVGLGWIEVGSAAGLELDQPETALRARRVYHEAFGQDGAVVDVSGGGVPVCDLIQFKYSRQGADPITWGDWVEISKALAKSSASARAAGFIVGKRCLVTNRPLGPRFRRSRAKLAARAALGVALDDTETVALAMEYELTASDAALKSLFAFLEGYGAVEEEAQRAINLWVGTLLLKSTESADVLVSAEDLISALLGTSAGRPLKIANVLPRARDELRGFVSLFASPPPRPVQRRLVQEIEKAASEHSLVLVYGGGGSGKTVALIEFAASRLGDSNSSVGALTAVDSADRASADLVRDIVRRWAGLSPSAGERMVDSAGEAIQRLVTANPDVERPVLCICLDGIDEAADGWDSNLREAMAYFARQVSVRTSDTQPIGTLVVTCRDPEDIARRYLGAADRTTGEVNRGIYGMVEVQEFDDVEFGRAWMTLEAGTVAERLMSVVDPHDLLDVFSEGPVPIASSGLPTRPPDPLMM